MDVYICRNLPELICPSVLHYFLVTWKVSLWATSLLRWLRRPKQTEAKCEVTASCLRRVFGSICVFVYALNLAAGLCTIVPTLQDQNYNNTRSTKDAVICFIANIKVLQILKYSIVDTLRRAIKGAIANFLTFCRSILSRLHSKDHRLDNVISFFLFKVDFPHLAPPSER